MKRVVKDVRIENKESDINENVKSETAQKNNKRKIGDQDIKVKKLKVVQKEKDKENKV